VSRNNRIFRRPRWLPYYAACNSGARGEQRERSCDIAWHLSGTKTALGHWMARRDRTRRPQEQAQIRKQLVSWLGTAVPVAFAVVSAAVAYHLLLSGDDNGDLCTSPRVWLQHDFLSAVEVEQLLAESASVGAECWDRVSETQQTAMLESCPRLAGTAMMQAVDRRVSTALGVELTHLEHGYLQQYTPNYTAHNLHLDQSELMVRMPV